MSTNLSDDTSRAQSGEFFPYATSFMAGLVVCLALSIAHGGQEAVDTAGYVPIGIPLMALAILVVSYLFPNRPWRWTLSMAAGQMTAMLLTGSSLSLWPIAMIAMLVVSIPQFVAGFVGAYFARRGARA